MFRDLTDHNLRDSILILKRLIDVGGLVLLEFERKINSSNMKCDI